MLDTIIYWLGIVPLGEPWRAIVLVGGILTFTFILHELWELGFKVTGRRGRSTDRSKV